MVEKRHARRALRAWVLKISLAALVAMAIVACSSSDGEKLPPVGATDWGCCLYADTNYCLCTYGEDPSDGQCKRIATDQCTKNERVCCGSFYTDTGQPRCGCNTYQNPCDIPPLPSDHVPTGALCPDSSLVTCNAAGETCAYESECCIKTTCVDFEAVGQYCAADCTSSSQCESGCCQLLNDGSKSVCAPASFCSG